MVKSQTKLFKFIHPISGDVFTYEDKKHAYKLNEIELPGTTTPLRLVNELSWDADGKMTDKGQIIQQWAIKQVVNTALDGIKKLFDLQSNDEYVISYKDVETEIIDAKSAPNKKFTGAGISGTEIHSEIEKLIKTALTKTTDGNIHEVIHPLKQVQNFIDWARNNRVKFLFSEEPLYSKEWMNCGTVDFICEIDGKVLIGDIKTNGDKRRYAWDTKKNCYDFKKPVSDIHIPALWQTGAYLKMATEEGARKLLDKGDGIVIINIKKSGEFSEELDVRYDFNVESLVRAYDCVLKLYKEFRNKI